MRAVRYHEHGDESVLTVEETDRPDPGPDELLVRVAAAGVNPVDTYFREGAYPLPSLPWVPGSDVAGEVEAVGDAVEGFEPGDRVYATGLGREEPGTCAEYVAVPERLAAPLPDAVAADEAAALALVGTTAWQAFVHHGEVGPGDEVLVHGGNGGVGHIAVQLARAMGATVTATARPEYHDRLLELGADRAFDYGRDDLADAVAEAGAPDVILGTVANRTIETDAEAAAPGARIVAIGNTEPTVAVPMGPGKFKDLRFQAMSMFNTPDTSAVLADLAGLVARGDIDPVVARTYDLDGVAEAHADVLNDSVLGKLVVEP
ncbi:NADPH:quinone reductase [Halosegnis marinus]|uniref:NADPH:quinone reductase n=1 Tax=Halosegnis marinus TaxID=3034023 RepID=A0ABD5ZJZ7_9EURY|nr:NADPH:quinone reductase [Halosegnis sp. DT85]